MRFCIDSNANQIHTKKVTNHLAECFKEEIIKTIEKKIGQVQVPADFV